jgi:hypothetical protein
VERALGRLEGVKTAKVRGFSRQDKMLYDLQVVEGKSLTPAGLKKALAAAGDAPDDYEYKGFEVELAGKVEKSGDGYTFTARGSNQKFSVPSHEDVKKLADAGKSGLTLTGMVTEEKGALALAVSEAKETASGK